MKVTMEIFKMSSVYDNVNGMILTMWMVNDDVFVVSNFSDHFYSAKKRSNNKQKRGGIFKILLARAGSNQSLEKIQHSGTPKLKGWTKKTGGNKSLMLWIWSYSSNKNNY